MTWKKGFQRVALLASIVVVGIGALITWDGMRLERATIKRYESIVYNDTAGVENGPWKEMALINEVSGETYESLINQHKEAYWGWLKEGLLGTAFAGAIPWALFGIGLYLVRGFRNP